MSCMHILAIAILSTAVSGPLVATGINSFSQAGATGVRINAGVPGDFYCDRKIDWQDKRGVINLESCGYKVYKNEDRVSRVEWEHVVPTWQLDHQRQRWQEGGRQDCAKDPKYRKMESGMHSLQPAVREVNDDRGNLMYNQWNDSEDQYGRYTMKVGFKGKVVEPPTRARDAIARTYFHMRDRYQLNLSRQQAQLFAARDRQYSVTAWECERDKRIAKAQDNHNPYVQQVCQA